MKIDGIALQNKIVEKLKAEILKLKDKGITPGIAIVTLGDEATWKAYVGQKIKLADRLGINKKVISLSPKTTEEVVDIIEKLNNDPSIHGIIVQRPFPQHIDTKRVIESVAREKDIDGFRDDSPYKVPVFLAVLEIIESIALGESKNLVEFISDKKILVVGKGETAGGPVINGFLKMGIKCDVIDSQTENRNEKFENADIVISAVGKTGIINVNNLKKTSILIGIGIHRGEEGLEGDYNDDQIRNKVAYFTPTPKGVGPVNLSFLFINLLKAAQNK